MLKLIYSLVRRPELSREEFQRYWFDVHAPLVRNAASVLAIRRYVQAHSLDTPLDAALIEGRGLEPERYDGHALLWWDSLEAMMAAMSTAEGRAAGTVLLNDETNFIDFSRSRMVFANERVVIG